jgi:hypothetical protein
LTILCCAPSHVAHEKDYHRSCASSAAHGKECVTPSPRGRPSITFLCRPSLIAHSKELCCVLHFPKAHDKGLCRAKNALCALCRALGQNPHGKGPAVRILDFAVHGKARESGSVNWTYTAEWDYKLFTM